MPLILKECSDWATFSHIVDCEWAAYYNPYHTFMQVLFPVLGGSSESRAAAIRESKERQWQRHQTDSSCHWLYVEDDRSREIIGGAQWQVHHKNPFEGPRPKFEAFWWPEGECRRFVNKMLEQMYEARRAKMTRPHISLDLMFVHPSHRRRGAGSLLTDWGMAQARKKGLEVFVEGTDQGRPLYERFGLTVMSVEHLDAYERNSSDEWRKLEREILPMHWYFMWKPAEGVYEKGKTAVPWDTVSNRH